jgi:hypothetical protein
MRDDDRLSVKNLSSLTCRHLGGGGWPAPAECPKFRSHRKKLRIFTATKAIYFHGPIPSNSLNFEPAEFLGPWQLNFLGRNGRKSCRELAAVFQ